VAVTADSPTDAQLEHENSWRVVWALAWPAVALNSLQVVNTLLDRFFLGHLETAALTAHGGATNVMFLMFSLAVAVATGATALVSRAYGAGKRLEYRRASRQSLAVALFAGLASAAITLLGSHVMASFVLPAKDVQAVRLMADFVVAYSLGLPAIYIVQALAGSLRGIGDTRSPMVISGIQILIHIALNCVLIFPTRSLGGIVVPGAGLGLVGAAIALAASAWIAAIIYVFYAGKTPLGFLLRFRLPEREWVVRILRIAVPAATMSVLRVLSLTAFTLALGLIPRGSEAIAAMSIGFAIESIMFMPAFGLSVAASALVGQSLGMKRPERAERLGWSAAHLGALVTVALALPVFFLADDIAAIMLKDKPAVVEEASTLLRYLCATEILFGYAMVLIGAMQGAGDTVRPMWISIFALWGMRVPLAFVMALSTGTPLIGSLTLPFGFGMGATGAWLAMALTQGVQGVMSIIAFKQGAWKTKKV